MSIKIGKVVEYAWSELDDGDKSLFNQQHPFSDPIDYRFFKAEQWDNKIIFQKRKNK